MSYNPRMEYTHDPHEKIQDLNDKKMVEIAGDWIKFFFTASEEDHPHSYYILPHDRRQQLDSLQENFHEGESKDEVGVWHLLGGNQGDFYRTHLPISRKWAIMFSPYVAFGSSAEFPSLTEDSQLQAFVTNDINSVYELVASIDGQILQPVRTSGSAYVNIGRDNVLGIDPANNVQVFFDGYFVLLRNLSLGDHIIESKGLAVNYENQIRYAVYVRK